MALCAEVVDTDRVEKFLKNERPKIWEGNTERVEKTVRDDRHEWLVRKWQEFEKKYAGKYLAIVGKQLVGVGDDPVKLDQEVERKYPSARILVVYVPKSREEVQIAV